MPIFKVTMTETETKTIVAYVEADSEQEADAWAAEIDDAGAYGEVTSVSDDFGTIEDTEMVFKEEVPASAVVHVIGGRA